MKVLMIAPGDSIHSQRPLKQLLEQGSTVVFIDTINPLRDQAANYQFIHYPFGRRCWYRRLGWVGEWLSNRLIVPWWQRVLHTIAPDVVHAHWVDCRAYFAQLAGARPLVLSVWGSDINNCFEPLANRYHCQAMGRLLLRADLTIIDAPNMRERCSELAGQRVPTETLHLGVNTEIFCPGYEEARVYWRNKLAISPNTKVVLSVRGLTAHYRHEEILRAFAKVRFETVLLFKIFNQHDTQYRNKLIELAKSLGLENSIRWLPEVSHPQMAELYALADVVVNFPVEDTLPISFVEAAACERPVVSCNLSNYHGTFAEQFLTLVPENSVDSLAVTMQQTLAAPPNMAPARKFVVEHLDEKLYTKRLLEIYRKI